jgi:hypothetical protein
MQTGDWVSREIRIGRFFKHLRITPLVAKVRFARSENQSQIFEKNYLPYLSML